MFKKMILGIIFLGIAAVLAIIIWPQKTYTPYIVSAQLQTKAENYPVPAMPEGWEWKTFIAKDGTALRWGQGGQNPNARDTVIYVPGFTSTLEHVAEHLTYFEAQGYHVIGLDLRGQGGSQRMLKNNPEKPWSSDFSIYSDDFAQFIGSIRPQISGRLFVIGSSFGGHVTYRAIGDHGLDVDGLILIAPAFKPHTNPYPYGVAKFVAAAMHRLGKSKFYSLGQGNWKPLSENLDGVSNCSSYAPRLNMYDAVFIQKPELKAGSATNQWAIEIMRSGELISTPEYAQQIKIPVHMIYAQHDTNVVTETAQKVCGQLENCSSKMLENSGHCIVFENDEIVQQFHTTISEFISQ